MSILPDQLRYLVQSHADEQGYAVVGRGSLTFGEWDRAASRFARGLIGNGVRPGDRVALFLASEDALTQLVAYVGAHKAGAVNVPLAGDLTPSELEAVLAHGEPTVVVAGRQASAAHMDVSRRSPSVRTVVALDPDAPATTTAWDGFLDDDDDDVQAPIGAHDIADIIYTSGTTGRPKGVVTRHDNATHIPIRPPFWNGEVWLHASPFSTSAGIAFVYVPMQLGMTGLYMPRFEPATFVELAEAGRFHMAFLVPAMVELLLARDDIDDRDLSAIKMITVGSAPSAHASLLRLNRLLAHGVVVNAFAMTESGAAQVVLPGDELEQRPGSVGKPVPPAELRVVDEDGCDVASGETGEILLRTPGHQREYWREDGMSDGTWRDGWLHTGDIGHVDDDGYLYIVGRKKDVIIRGGKNIHATDVETVLLEHPAITEAAVVGTPHDVLGEEVVAFVACRPGHDVPDEELAEHCAVRLPRYKVPRQWHRRDSLPRNPMGKVVKARLLDDLTHG